jgi:hypothetical protein
LVRARSASSEEKKKTSNWLWELTNS